VWHNLHSENVAATQDANRTETWATYTTPGRVRNVPIQVASFNAWLSENYLFWMEKLLLVISALT